MIAGKIATVACHARCAMDSTRDNFQWLIWSRKSLFSAGNSLQARAAFPVPSPGNFPAVWRNSLI
jgi:hypothetical protein